MQSITWLVRTHKNILTGPYSKEDICKLIMDSKLYLDDEICEANSYWIYLYEKAEVQKQLGINPPAHLLKKSSEFTQTVLFLDQEAQTDPLVQSIERSTGQKNNPTKTLLDFDAPVLAPFSLEPKTEFKNQEAPEITAVFKRKTSTEKTLLPSPELIPPPNPLSSQTELKGLPISAERSQKQARPQVMPPEKTPLPSQKQPVHPVQLVFIVLAFLLGLAMFLILSNRRSIS